MMVKDKYIHKLYAFALAAVFALTLAGCGGGGGSATAPTTPDPDPTPMPSPQEMCEADGGRYNADGSCTSAADLAEEMALSGAQEAAMAAYMMAKGYVDGAVDPVAMSKAKMYADMAKEASDAAAMATTSEMAMEYQMKAEMNRDMAMEAAGMPGLGLIMLANKSLNDDDIENAGLAGTTPPKAANNATNVGAAMAVAGGATTTDADLTIDTATVAGSMTNQGGKSGGTDNTDGQLLVATVDATPVAKHGASGSTFAIAFGTTRFLTGETPSRFQTKGGWEAQDLLLPDGTAGSMLKSHLVVSTDIQATTKKDVYDKLADSDTASDVVMDGVITGDVPNDGSDFVASYNAVPDDNNAPRSGEIYCPTDRTTGCSISVDEDGKIVSVSGYQFSTSKTSTDSEDGDYLTWGVWVQGSIRDTILGDAVDIEAQAGAFAYGSDRFNVTAELRGTATYNGVATGLYSAAGMVSYFDADVMLEANFGGNTGADNSPETGNADQNDGLLIGVVSGTVSNIKAGGMDVDGSLTLKNAKVLTTTPNGASDDGFTGATEGTLGGIALKGMWGGQFYGPQAKAARDIPSTYPTTAAGTFGATGGGHTPVSLLGAFGTWKAE